MLLMYLFVLTFIIITLKLYVHIFQIIKYRNGNWHMLMKHNASHVFKIFIFMASTTIICKRFILFLSLFQSMIFFDKIFNFPTKILENIEKMCFSKVNLTNFSNVWEKITNF
jgi:hypothetical protein